MPRVLYVPMYSSPENLKTCSTFAWANVFFQHLLDSYEDVFLHFMWPTCADIHPEWLDHPRVELIEFTPNDSQYTESFNLPSVVRDRFGAFAGTSPLDVLITDKHACMPGLRLSTEYPTIYNRRTYVLNMQFDFTKELHEVSPNVEAIQAVATTDADMVICRDERVFDQVFTTARKHVSSKRAARLLDNKWIGGYTFDDDMFGKGVDPEVRAVPPPFVANFAYAFTTSNHVVEIVSAYRELCHSGYDLRFLLTTPSKNPGNFHDQVSKEEWGPFLLDHYALPRGDFYRRLNTAHLFVYWPITRGFCGSPLEQTAFGLLGIYHYVNKPPWINDQYPFLFHTASDIPHVLKDAMDKYNEPWVRRLVKNLQQKVADLYSGKRDAAALASKIFEISSTKKECEQDSRRWLHDLIFSILERYTPDVIRWQEIKTWLHSRPYSKKLIVGDASSGFGGYKVGNDHLRFAMEDIGWIDDCQHLEPLFHREPEKARPQFLEKARSQAERAKKRDPEDVAQWEIAELVVQEQQQPQSVVEE